MLISLGLLRFCFSETRTTELIGAWMVYPLATEIRTWAICLRGRASERSKVGLGLGARVRGSEDIWLGSMHVMSKTKTEQTRSSRGSPTARVRVPVELPPGALLTPWLRSSAVSE